MQKGFLSNIKHKIASWILFFLCLLLFISTINSRINLSKRANIFKNAQDRVHQASEKQKQLERELARVQSQQYIEEQAREKLNLSREGEITLIIPTISITQDPMPTPVENLANWQKWWKVFL